VTVPQHSPSAYRRLSRSLFKITAPAAAGAWVWLVDLSQTLACPTCKDSLAENGEAGAQLARGFELSIYLMLVVPMLIFATLVLAATLAVRRAQRNGHYPSFDELVAAAAERGTAPRGGAG
jgi:hypothetical protein